MSDRLDRAQEDKRKVEELLEKIGNSPAYKRRVGILRRTKMRPTDKDSFMVQVPVFKLLQQAIESMTNNYVNYANEEMRKAIDERRQASDYLKQHINDVDKEKSDYKTELKKEHDDFLEEHRQLINSYAKASRIMRNRVNKARGKPNRAEGWYLISHGMAYLPNKYKPYNRLYSYKISTPLDGVLGHEAVFLKVKNWLSKHCEIRYIEREHSARVYFNSECSRSSQAEKARLINNKVFNLKLSTDTRYGNWIVSFESFEELGYLSALQLLNS